MMQSKNQRGERDQKVYSKDNYKGTKKQKESPNRSKSKKSVGASPPSRYSHQNTSKVSYGELQIILQNIKQIKHKAKEDITALEEQNALLKAQILRLKEENTALKQMQKVKNIQQRIELQSAIQIRQQQRIELQSVIQIRQQQRIKQQQIQKPIQQVQQEYDINQILSQYNQIIKIVTNNHPTLLNQCLTWLQVLYKQHPNHLVYETYNLIVKDNQQLNQTIIELRQKNRTIQQLKQKAQYTFEVLKKENIVLKNKMQELEATKTENIQVINQLHKEVQNIKQQLLQSKSQKQQTTQQLNQLHIQYNQLKTLMLQLQKDREQQQSINQYTKIVNEICAQQIEKDYRHILHKIQHLQRFKAQYYYNVDKMQFLCKMLD